MPSSQICIKLDYLKFVFLSLKVVIIVHLGSWEENALSNALDQPVNTIALLVLIKKANNIVFFKCWGSYWTISSSSTWLLGMRNIVFPLKVSSTIWISGKSYSHHLDLNLNQCCLPDNRNFSIDKCQLEDTSTVYMQSNKDKDV